MGQAFRIKADYVIPSNFTTQTKAILQALKTYGMYLGDGGGSTALKLEDTVREGRGQAWDVGNGDLCGLPFTPAYWDVLPEGYNPSAAR